MHTVQERKRVEYERYEAYRQYEEKTDIGERLTLPIENYSELLVESGRVYGWTLEGTKKRMVEWSQQAYDESQVDPGFSGANSIERTRREIELDEALAVEQLQPGEMLEVLSPIPDVVMAGQTTLSGYRRDMARTLGRAYYYDGERMHTVTYSLEQSNKQALEAAAKARGMAIHASMGSEDMLRARHVSWASIDEFRQLADQVRFHYDQALYMQTGTVYYAGSRIATKQDSMAFINQQTDLIEQHMRALTDIQTALLDTSEKQRHAEQLRQRTAAAIDERLHGGLVESISDAAVGDRMSAGDYGGECATSGTAQGSQAELGLAQGKHMTNCPLCGARGVTATVSGETITCSECLDGINICTGELIKAKRKVSLRETTPTRTSTQSAPRRMTKQLVVMSQFGEHARLRTELSYGGADQIIYDRRTGEQITKL